MGIINDVTDDRTINVGSIEVTNKFTFFDVFEDQFNQVMTAFEGKEDMKVDIAKGSRSGGDSEFGDRKPKSNNRRFNDRKSTNNKQKSYKKSDDDRDYPKKSRSKSSSSKSSYSDKKSSNDEKPWRNKRR